jgi:ribosome-binding ATPase YchF (GTP1/OBG family)
MDEKFLEFLGNFFLAAARGQKQVADIMRFSQKGLSGFEDLSEVFNRIYGLDRLSKTAPEYLELWKKAAETFQESFKEYMKTMGVIPREEHLELVQKYELLKKKVTDQQETIKHLQMLLSQKGSDQGETMRIFQELMKKQSEQFIETMNTIGKSFKQKEDDRPK